MLLQPPFWTPWYPLARLGAGAPRGAAPLVAMVKPSHWCFLSCSVIPLLSPTLRFHCKCCFAARILFWGSYQETGLVGAAQPAQALRRMVEWDLRAQGSCATSECLFSPSLPTFPLVADVRAFSISAEAQGGWRQHPVLPLLLSSCRAVKKALQKHIT